MGFLEYNHFTYYLGETIEFCQTVEHDVKWIYAIMLKGNDSTNYKKISKWSLGKTINELEELDNSDGKPYLSKKGYKTLRSINEERNYLCHQIYRDFLYSGPNWEQSSEYSRACDRLMDFHEALEGLRDNIQELRIELSKVYA